MKITMIHGQNHKGTTYHIGKMLADKLEGEVTEFFLPRDFGEFCTGCTSCFMKSEKLCPHYEKLKPITTALKQADIIILTSPVYVYHSTGPMKAWLDHYGYQWLVHRPDESMFSKQAVCISTAAGGGMKSTNKDMADSLSFWGISKIYKYGIAVRAISYKEVTEETKRSIDKKTSKIAEKIKRSTGRLRPSLKIRGYFRLMRLLQKKGWNEADCRYWQEKGWTGKNRPWNDTI